MPGVCAAHRCSEDDARGLGKVVTSRGQVCFSLGRVQQGFQDSFRVVTWKELMTHLSEHLCIEIGDMIHRLAGYLD